MLRNTRSKLINECNIPLAVMTIHPKFLFQFRYVSQLANKLKKYV
jgi:hypothetical protein